MAGNGLSLRIGTFNTHWHGSTSAFESPVSFAATVLGRPSSFGHQYEGFPQQINSFLEWVDIGCFQEVELYCDPDTGEYLPCLPPQDNYQWFCSPILDTHNTGDIPHVPHRLRNTPRTFGNAIAVKRDVHVERLDDLIMSDSPAEISRQRRFPVVRIHFGKDDFIVVDVHTLVPTVGFGKTTHAQVHELFRASAQFQKPDKSMPVVLAGDFNYPLWMMKRTARRYEGAHPDIADVGGPTWPRPHYTDVNGIPKSKWKPPLGTQLDHIIGLYGATVQRVHGFPMANTSDHMPLVSLVSARALDRGLVH